MRPKYLLYLACVALIAMAAFIIWQHERPCPSNDELGLWHTCKVKATGNPNDPLGIL